MAMVKLIENKRNIINLITIGLSFCALLLTFLAYFTNTWQYDPSVKRGVIKYYEGTNQDQLASIGLWKKCYNGQGDCDSLMGLDDNVYEKSKKTVGKLVIQYVPLAYVTTSLQVARSFETFGIFLVLSGLILLTIYTYRPLESKLRQLWLIRIIMLVFFLGGVFVLAGCGAYLCWRDNMTKKVNKHLIPVVPFKPFLLGWSFSAAIIGGIFSIFSFYLCAAIMIISLEYPL